jgi:hypothetical protein
MRADFAPGELDHRVLVATGASLCVERRCCVETAQRT